MAEGQEFNPQASQETGASQEELPAEVTAALGEVLANELPEFKNKFNEKMNKLADGFAEAKIRLVRSQAEHPVLGIGNGVAAFEALVLESGFSKLAKKTGGRQVTSAALKQIPGYSSNER